MREASIERNTKETKVLLKLNLDGEGKSKINTGVGFIDHMLDLFAFHSGIDLEVTCQGDLEVDCHHSIEDIGIVLGQAINKALGDKKGINRYGHFVLAMDETLVETTLDISNRAFLVYHVELKSQHLGNFDTEMTEEFFRAVAFNTGMTLHINERYGSNTHHIIEACFKSFARALKQAIQIDQQNKDKVISSKGVL